MKWDEYFSDIARVVSEKSKDPSSKIGAVIVGPENQILSTGYNGFPRGIDEADPKRWERPLKYDLVCHAEANAVHNAARHGIALRGCSLYLFGFGPPTVPCISCTKIIIQVGIKKVVGKYYKPAAENWLHDLELSMMLLNEAGVEFREFEYS